MEPFDHLQDIAAFVAIGRLGSLARASDELGVPVLVVSRRLSTLERWTGVKLAMRGSRGTLLTPAGQAYFERAQPLFQAVQAAYTDTVATTASVGGRMVVVMPGDFAQSWITPILGGFIQANPAIELELDLRAEDADPARLRVDLAIRVGPVLEQHLIARPLGSIARQLLAAPEYLHRAPPLRHPLDLVGHPCILLDTPSGGATWTFSRGDETVRVTVAGRLSTNQVPVARRFVSLGLGVSALPSYPALDVHGEPQVDAAVQVLPDWQLAPLPVHALLPSRLVPMKTKLFVDYLLERLRFPTGETAGGL